MSRYRLAQALEFSDVVAAVRFAYEYADVINEGAMPNVHFLARLKADEEPIRAFLSLPPRDHLVFDEDGLVEHISFRTLVELCRS
jgi:hypothetical protein